ncbi:hypothetical protein OIE43_19020 [Streptomyces pseudovenezuelae]|uniref:hypothetical protein n=1 Tax=Streptomyces pseudovenezuelae TaxID=67350 RepID=UPI002E380620|nr:hypothetical protein [Streptomyces pseudovenezuelae]
MTTKTTFEDRLLAELQGEIEQRESAPVPAARRPLLTGRRLALAAGLCAAAGFAVVAVPGTPAESPAYALERHDDGTVTLTANEQYIDVDDQRELARQLRPNGIEVDVQILRPGYICEGDTVIWSYDREGQRAPIFTFHWARKITLHRGNVLVFVNFNDGTDPHRVDVYPTEADVQPCVPVKPTPDRSRSS